MSTIRTPDVYVREITLLPPSVAEVATAVPAFVGYTEKAVDAEGRSLSNRARRIKNLLEYEQLYGGPNYVVTATVDNAVTPPKLTAVEIKTTFLLYESLRLYFENGGGPCYVVSVGTYGDTLGVDPLKAGLDVLAKEDEPTLLVAPDAVNLTDAQAGDVAKKALQQAGRLMDRFALIDVKMKSTAALDIAADRDTFRTNVGINDLRFGAAYYPFVRSSLPLGVRLSHITWKLGDGTERKLADFYTGDLATLVTALQTAYTSRDLDEVARLEAQVRSASPLYREVLDRAAASQLLVPPSGAVAGVYAATDANRGVWKAPANVSLAGVVEPVAKLDAEDQGDFNIDPSGGGKSINVIRGFYGKGVLVWGARTLAGNDREWRYINVRRFFSFAEESIKKSTYWAVFEPNDANTWVRVKAMIENFLTEQWRAGALQGAKPEQAFTVKCGLGTTMTPQDILDGRMNVEVEMAVVRPAEFIILRFSHKMAAA